MNLEQIQKGCFDNNHYTMKPTVEILNHSFEIIQYFHKANLCFDAITYQNVIYGRNTECGIFTHKLV